MGWFTARIILEGTAANAPTVFEESMRVIQARSKTEAYARAETLASELSHSYLNAEKTPVQWQATRVAEVIDLCEETLFDGVEVYSRLSHEPL